jgi:hypothetical protein
MFVRQRTLAVGSTQEPPHSELVIDLLIDLDIGQYDEHDVGTPFDRG